MKQASAPPLQPPHYFEQQVAYNPTYDGEIYTLPTPRLASSPPPPFPPHSLHQPHPHAFPRQPLQPQLLILQQPPPPPTTVSVHVTVGGARGNNDIAGQSTSEDELELELEQLEMELGNNVEESNKKLRKIFLRKIFVVLALQMMLAIGVSSVAEGLVQIKYEISNFTNTNTNNSVVSDDDITTTKDDLISTFMEEESYLMPNSTIIIEKKIIQEFVTISIVSLIPVCLLFSTWRSWSNWKLVSATVLAIISAWLVAIVTCGVFLKWWIQFELFLVLVPLMMAFLLIVLFTLQSCLELNNVSGISLTLVGYLITFGAIIGQNSTPTLVNDRVAFSLFGGCGVAIYICILVVDMTDVSGGKIKIFRKCSGGGDGLTFKEWDVAIVRIWVHVAFAIFVIVLIVFVIIAAVFVCGFLCICRIMSAANRETRVVYV